MLRDISAEMGQLVRISTPELLRRMLDKQDPSADWATCDRGRPINAFYLRARLRDVLPHPRKPEHKHWTVGGKDVHGYTAVEFEDAYRRYLGEDNLEASGASAEKTQLYIPPESSGPSGTATDNPCNFNAVDQCSIVNEVSSTAGPASGTAGNPAPAPDAVLDAVPDVPDTSSPSSTAGKPANSLGKIVPVPDGPDDSGGMYSGVSESPSEPQPKSEEDDEIW
jgi:hypothetical protein